MRTWNRWIVAALLSASLTSCGKPDVVVSRNNGAADAGDASSSPDGGGNIPLPDGAMPGVSPEIREAHNELTVAECSTAFRCCSSEEIDARYGGFESADDCNDSRQLFPDSFGLSAYTTALDEERIEFDLEMALLCASSFAEQDCEDWTTAPLESMNPGCAEAIRPLTQPGEPCKFDFECAGSFCKASAEPEGLGTCTETAAEGEDCVSEDVICGAGLFCERFFAQTCLKQYAEGEPCTDDFECESGNCATLPDNTRECRERLPICLGP